jgi:hypothetical protein
MVLPALPEGVWKTVFDFAYHKYLQPIAHLLNPDRQQILPYKSGISARESLDGCHVSRVHWIRELSRINPSLSLLNDGYAIAFVCKSWNFDGVHSVALAVKLNLRCVGDKESSGADGEYMCGASGCYSWRKQTCIYCRRALWHSEQCKKNCPLSKMCLG